MVHRLSLTCHTFFQRFGLSFLRNSLAIVFFWFGILKPLGLSPAAQLVESTVFWFSSSWFVPVLGFWEMAIGILMFTKRSQLALFLLLPHMAGTFLPLIVVPEVTFVNSPLILSLEGQYIIKNLVLIASAIAVTGLTEVSQDKAG